MLNRGYLQLARFLNGKSPKAERYSSPSSYNYLVLKLETPNIKQKKCFALHRSMLKYWTILTATLFLRMTVMIQGKAGPCVPYERITLTSVLGC